MLAGPACEPASNFSAKAANRCAFAARGGRKDGFSIFFARSIQSQESGPPGLTSHNGPPPAAGAHEPAARN
jgi:hypothetical protein